MSRSLETPPPAPPAPKASEFQHFISRPDLQPPTVAVRTHSSRASFEDIFLAPYAGTGEYGPMILDGSGRLLWFKRLPAGARAADLRMQEYEGKPVLTWWQDPITAGGHSGSGLVIADSSYREIAVVRAGNGYEPDLHSFTITPQGTAFTTVYDAIRCNLRPRAGPQTARWPTPWSRRSTCAPAWCATSGTAWTTSRSAPHTCRRRRGARPRHGTSSTST